MCGIVVDKKKKKHYEKKNKRNCVNTSVNKENDNGSEGFFAFLID